MEEVGDWVVAGESSFVAWFCSFFFRTGLLTVGAMQSSRGLLLPSGLPHHNQLSALKPQGQINHFSL